MMALPRHGKKGTRVYQVWVDMVRRCGNPNRRNFHNYGGRGISVCDRWKKFELFYADMGDPPDGRTIERLDNDGNYEPNNCKWGTPLEQSTNRRMTIFLLFRGERLSAAEVARRLGLRRTAMYYRIKQGWDIDRIVGPRERW